jgi:hypothetical protein
LVAVFDFPSNTFSLYLNGSLAASANGLGRLFGHGGDVGIGAMNVSARFHDGSQYGGPSFFFNGVIDEVAIYPTALSASVVANHHTVGTP